jgi:C-terminal processing protease CtpA/Prc
VVAGQPAPKVANNGAGSDLVLDLRYNGGGLRRQRIILYGGLAPGTHHRQAAFEKLSFNNKTRLV